MKVGSFLRLWLVPLFYQFCAFILEQNELTDRGMLKLHVPVY